MTPIGDQYTFATWREWQGWSPWACPTTSHNAQKGSRLVYCISWKRGHGLASPNGRSVDFTYDLGNRITQATDNSGRLVIYVYDISGRLVKVTDPNGGITEYTYDDTDPNDPIRKTRMLTVKDARGIVFLINQYDADGRVIKQTQADGTVYQFAYTVEGATNRITQTDLTGLNGEVRRVAFNESGYVISNTLALGTPQTQTTIYELEQITNRVLSETDSLGRKTAYTYDDMGNVTRIIRLAGTQEAVTTTFTYEPTFNKVTSITDPLNHTTYFMYDSKGNLTQVIDPLLNQTAIAYNAAGQPISITDSLGNTTQFTYAAGDATGTTDSLGNGATRLIDSVGRLLRLTNALGHPTQYTYDALNRMTQLTDARTSVTGFSYDPNGNLLSVTDAKGNGTMYTYDNMDRLATRKDPMLKQENYLYDNMGSLTTFTDRNAQSVTFTYDILGRRTKAAYADGTTTTYDYDKGNRLTQIMDASSGTAAFTYDNLDRLTQETTSQGAIAYTYDKAGRRMSMTMAGQPMVAYSYDNANRLIQVSQGSSTTAISYDVAGRRTSLTLPNGVVVGYVYDPASRLTGMTYKKGVTLLGDLTYAYDATGNRTKTGGRFVRTNLPLALSSASYNATNQQTNLGGQNLTYDANGNLTSDGTNTYTWDARNRLASLTRTGLSAIFAYDAMGRRISKTINGVTTQYLYDGNDIVGEIQNSVLTTTYLRGLNIDEPFVRQTISGSEYYLADALGSVIALTNAAGTTTTTYTYDPFGNTTVTGTSTNVFQYTGRENDGTGLYYYRARYYSPKMQRFISEDPILVPFTPISVGFGRAVKTVWLLPMKIGAADTGISGLLNAFVYAMNDPVLRRDPNGLISPGPCEKTLQKCFDIMGGSYETCIRNKPDPYPGDCKTKGKCGSGDTYASCWGSNYSSAASKCWITNLPTVTECQADEIVANCE